MDFMIGSESIDFNEFDSMSIQEIQDKGKSDRRLINMHFQENTLYREGNWDWPIEEKLVLKPYLVDYTGKLIILNKTDVVADLKSFGDIKQDESNHLSNVSNFALIGLSWMGVGTIPLVLGMDIRLRINLRESEVNEWVNSENNNFTSWRKGKHDIIT